MSTNHVEELKKVQQTSAKLVQSCPEIMEAFGKLHDIATKKGTLTLKQKELIAIGISVVIKCVGCIQHHVKAAISAGATKEEISEAVGMAIVMGGGPATIYGAKAIEAMEQFFH